MKKTSNSLSALELAVVSIAALSATPSVQAQTYTTLHSFCTTRDSNGYCTDGYSPNAGLMQDTNGDLYGTVGGGGATDLGTVYKVTTRGKLTTLHSFSGTDGANPEAGLIQATNGDLYGTTQGQLSEIGTVFKITPNGKLTTLDFMDGAGSVAVLLQAPSSDFYGTTRDGGADDVGTVFKISPSGTLTTLHSFDGTDGSNPTAGLIPGPSAELYGIASGGGAFLGGTVFKITLGGALTTLYSFCSKNDCADGYYPLAGLLQATNGDFYGTTFNGGANQAGTVFKITTSGKLTTLYSFCSQTNCVDGAAPQGALIQASDGNLYGTTTRGGAYDGGMVFRITSSGTLTTVYSFCMQGTCVNGSAPVAGLIQASDGNFYGTTFDGGSAGAGTIFKLSLGLEPPAQTVAATEEPR